MSDARQTPVLSVVEAVAVATRTDPTELPPIADAVDPDALNRLFARPTGTPSTVSITFTYAGRDVTVSSTDGQLDCTVSAVLAADGGAAADATPTTACGPTAD